MRVRLFALLLSAAVGVATSATHAIRPSPADRFVLPTRVPAEAVRAGSSQPRAVPSAVPGAPMNLSQSVVGTTVTLNWTAPTTGGVPTGYIVEASLTASGPVIASLPLAVTTLTVPNVPVGIYFVRVRAVNGDGAGPPSNQVIVNVGNVCNQPPNAPGTLVTTPPGPSVTLNWSPPVGGCAPTGFVVRAGAVPGQPTIAIPVGTNTTLSGTAPPGTYFVSVVAVNAFGQSAPSNEVAVVIVCAAPGAPVGLGSTVNGNNVALTWGPPATGGAATGYVLEAGLSSGTTIVSLPLPTNAFAIAAPNGTFFVRVKATNACGVGPPSNEHTLVVPSCGPPLGAPATPSADVSGPVPIISWPPVNGAARYRLEVGTAMGASNTFSQIVNGTSQALAGLSTGTYFMRVRGIDACNSAGPPSGEGQFTVNVGQVLLSIAVTGPPMLVVGENGLYTAMGTFTGGTMMDVTATASWSSSNAVVAAVAGPGSINALAEGTTNVSATLQQRTGTQGLLVIPPPSADFVVNTDADTLDLGVNPGQCAASRETGRQNKLRCRFDGSISTPGGNISGYSWDFSNNGPQQLPDAIINGNDLNFICGSFGPPNDGVAADVEVTLTVTAGGATSTVTRRVTVIKVGAC